MVKTVCFEDFFFHDHAKKTFDLIHIFIFIMKISV